MLFTAFMSNLPPEAWKFLFFILFFSFVKFLPTLSLRRRLLHSPYWSPPPLPNFALASKE